MICCARRDDERAWAFTFPSWRWSHSSTLVGQPVVCSSSVGCATMLTATVPSHKEGKNKGEDLAGATPERVEGSSHSENDFKINSVSDASGEQCPVCGEVRPVLINESWAGQLHSACSHGACESCLARWVVSELPRCRAERMLRVRCIDQGCPKVMPQPLVHHALSVAQVPACVTELTDGELDLHMCIFGPRNEQPPKGPHVCPICCEGTEHLLRNVGCEHSACSSCWGRWVEVHIPIWSSKREMPEEVQCFNPECCAVFAPPLLRHACSESLEASRFLVELDRRSRLQQNLMFPQEMQVNCPRPGCVGLGYLGFDQVMCFICEHQWTSNGSEPEDKMPDGVIKACPKCSVNIEKTGGCDHMTCSQCRHEFCWTTLANYRSG